MNKLNKLAQDFQNTNSETAFNLYMMEAATQNARMNAENAARLAAMIAELS